jgi:cell division septum initiation protein DivIVA
MAGEVIGRIRSTEEEASRIVEKARREAGEIIEGTAEKKQRMIEHQDELLAEEEKQIQRRYREETEELLRGVEEEERRRIEQVNVLCERNLQQVVEHVAREIVKE